MILNMSSICRIRSSAMSGNLNLSRISFIEPYSMLSLLLMGRNYLRKSGNKLKLSGIPINIHQYLHRMDFFKTGVFDVPERLNEKLLLKRSSFSNRVLEITEIPNKERESVRVISMHSRRFQEARRAYSEILAHRPYNRLFRHRHLGDMPEHL